MARPTTNTTTPAGTGGYILAKVDEGQLAVGSRICSRPLRTARRGASIS